MNGDEMRCLISKICKNASAHAREAGFNIDFERELYINCSQYSNVWYMNVTHKKSPCVENDGVHIHMGAEFTHHVPPIDRFKDIDYDIVKKSPVGRLAFNSSDHVVRIPIADEFAYKYSDKALEMILNALMRNGSWIMIENPNMICYNDLLEKENIRFTAEYISCKAHINHPLSVDDINMLGQVMSRHTNEVKRIKDMMKPVRIPLVPKGCSSFDELNIILDLNAVE